MRPSKATIEELDKLAQELTPKQRAFAEAYAADPERNITHAAIKAGSGKRPDVTGQKWLGLTRVRSYIDALTFEGRKLAQAKTGEVVGTLAEALALKTAAMRHAHPQLYLKPTESGTLAYDHAAVLAAPIGTLKDVDRDETGDIRPKFHDAQAAADGIIAHYTGKNRPPEGNKTLILNVLGNLTPEIRDSAVAALLEAGETG